MLIEGILNADTVRMMGTLCTQSTLRPNFYFFNTGTCISTRHPGAAQPASDIFGEAVFSRFPSIPDALALGVSMWTKFSILVFSQRDVSQVHVIQHSATSLHLEGGIGCLAL
jgi:hypothetical protein